MFIPKRTKFKKQHKGKNFNKIAKPQTLYSLHNGSICLIALEAGRLTTKHLTTCRQTVNKIVKRVGKISMNILTDTPISKKPIEIRMGKGKGAVDHWVKKVQAGDILIEIETKQMNLAIKALETTQIKIPLKTRIQLEK